MAQHVDSPIIVAFDVPTLNVAMKLAVKLDPNICTAKIGLQLFVTEGPIIVEMFTDLGYRVFLDLKFGDIPETMVQAILSAARHRVWMTNFHADKLGKKWLEKVDGKPSVIEQMQEGLEKIGHRPIIIGVTVLTSMDADDLEANGVPCPTGTVLPQVLRLARRVKKFGFDGIVSSSEEATPVRRDIGEEFIIVTPGIRLPKDNSNDQSRIGTPEYAIEQGADYLVVGRPITTAPDPQAALNVFYERACLARNISSIHKEETT